MKRVLICSTLLALLASVAIQAAESSGEATILGTHHSAEFEESVAAFYDHDAETRLRAVQELSGWALDGTLRDEALALLALARHDAELRVVLQAEVALAALTGGDRAAVRAAYGIVPPDPRKLAVEALQARTPKERLSALVALGRWHRESEIDTLLAATRDPAAAAVRLQALEFLHEIASDRGADPRLNDAFARAVQDSEPAIRKFAESVVRSQG